MANTYPYVPSAGPLVRTIEHLRRSFPKEVTTETLRKLGVAPKNESYVINVLRFLEVIDEDGAKHAEKGAVFLKQKDEDFEEAFEELVSEAYAELFELHADGVWSLESDALTQFFRTSDHSTEVVGKRQTSTFRTLAGFAGHGDRPTATAKRPEKKPASTKKPTNKKKKPEKAAEKNVSLPDESPRVGLTVRIEVNLPAQGDQETYDRIFRSIRENFIDAN